MKNEQMQREQEISLPPEIDGWPGARYGVSLRPQNSRVFVETLKLGNTECADSRTRVDCHALASV